MINFLKINLNSMNISENLTNFGPIIVGNTSFDNTSFPKTNNNYQEEKHSSIASMIMLSFVLLLILFVCCCFWAMCLVEVCECDFIFCIFRKRRRRRESNDSNFSISSGYYYSDTDSDTENYIELKEVKVDIKQTNWDDISIRSTDHICSICCEYLDNSDKVVKLDCNHVYHYDCINKWHHMSVDKTSCPMCREYIL